MDGVPCVFPFVYGGREYNACTPEGDFDGRAWCSTHVDAFQQHKGEREWGYCTDSIDCPL